MDKKQGKKTPNVEFGMEFGDINAAKLFEAPFSNRDKAKKGDKKEDC